MVEVTGLWRYPVKSMRGQELAEADVEPWGLAGDRRWIVVDPDGVAVTARELNALFGVRPEPTATGVRLRADGAEPLDVAAPDPAGQVPFTLFGTALTGAAAGDGADRWLTDLLGRPLRLVHHDDPTRRPTGSFGRPEDRVSFADAYPLLIASEESLTALNDDIGGDEPLPMRRFRPNVVVRGAAAWAEDDWRLIRIGEVTFRAVKGCDRCVMTTIDPDTIQRGKEPIATLARTRRFDGATWFGTNLVPDLPVDGAGPWPRLRVGDEVEVLDAVPSGGGPQR